jgi:serine O-acetyltransferase
MFKEVSDVLFGGLKPRVRLYLRLIIYFRNSKRFRLATFVSNRLQRKHGLFISRKAQFSLSLDLKHPVGIVIGEGVKIGERVVIFQNVTLGGARIGDSQQANYPEIGDDTVIYAGAIIVGKIKIGRCCVVGANAVVTKDVPDYATVAGIPARIIKQRKSEADEMMGADA